jgi:hypothetical protein
MESSQTLNSKLNPFHDQNPILWTKTTYHEVAVKLGFPCCYFKRWFMKNWVCDWTWVSTCKNFLTRTKCICNSPLWGATTGIWRRLCSDMGVPEDLLCSLWIHLQWLYDVPDLPGSRERAGMGLIH